ncbi:MAG TPA: peptide deformylase [Thermoflexia bacterium]|nr:peptide deformylase [Thermoflexia bacterium]
MTVREVITIGDDRLRDQARAIEKSTPEITRLIEDMIETMHVEGGVGLAASQIAELVRLILVEVPEDEEVPGSGELYVVLNPEITKTSGDEITLGVEGCLSIPGYLGEVERHAWVVVQGLDRRGKRWRKKVEGFLARVFQHEIDHTNGILYIDRLTAPERFWKEEAFEGDEVLV